MTVSSPPSVMSVHEQDVRCGALRHHRHSPSSALPRCHHAVTVDVAHVARGPRTRVATFDIDVASRCWRRRATARANRANDRYCPHWRHGHSRCRPDTASRSTLRERASLPTRPSVEHGSDRRSPRCGRAGGRGARSAGSSGRRTSATTILRHWNWWRVSCSARRWKPEMSNR